MKWLWNRIRNPRHGRQIMEKSRIACHNTMPPSKYPQRRTKRSSGGRPSLCYWRIMLITYKAVLGNELEAKRVKLLFLISIKVIVKSINATRTRKLTKKWGRRWLKRVDFRKKNKWKTWYLNLQQTYRQ